MNRWDLRNPWLVKLCWGVCAVMVFCTLVAMVVANNRPRYSSDAWKEPAAKVYYGPLECWADDGPTMPCQRPYNIPEVK